MAINYKILQRESTVLMFDRADSINPRSSFQVMRVGDRGMVHSLMGPGFYKLLEGCGLDPFKALGLTSVYAAVSSAHLVLMRTMLQSRVRIEQHGECLIEGHVFNWVLLTAVEPAIR